MDVAKRSVRNSAVAPGVDVFAASEQQAVHALEHAIRVVPAQNWQDVWPGAGGSDGGGVRGVRTLPQDATDKFRGSGYGDGG